jgi:hypothetical protein
LWGRTKKRILLPGVFLLLATAANTQVLLWKDHRLPSQPDSLFGKLIRKPKLDQGLDYSFTFSNDLFLNWKHDGNVSQVVLLQYLKYHFSFSGDTLFSFSGYFTHNLGFQSYFDSISRFQTDDNTLNTRFEVRLYRNLNLACNSNLGTRFTNGYDYLPGTGGTILRTLNSSFCTPLIWTFSGGVTMNWKHFGSLNLGVSSAKLTFIRDKSIFRKQQVTMYYGVPEGKDHLLEYGLSLQFLADRDVFKQLHWNCDLLLFQNDHSPVDVTLKNNFGIRINRFLKASIATRILYEEKVCRRIQVENLVTLGFYVHL